MSKLGFINKMKVLRKNYGNVVERREGYDRLREVDYFLLFDFDILSVVVL